MVDDFIKKTAKTLEESFFAKENRRLLEKLKNKAAKEALAEASGIADSELLDRLQELALCSETVAALAIVPLIEVAWADGTIQPKERDAILKAAEDRGIGKETSCHAMLENWLNEKPDDRLLHVWADYVKALGQVMGPQDREKLRNDLLGRAQAVAEAAGGFLGLTSKVSAEEKAVMEKMAEAFD